MEEHADALVSPSLRALLHEIVDYAGLFPPAELRFGEAIRNYAHYREEPEAWMLSRFVLPIARFDDLDEYVRLFSAETLRLAVLGTGGRTAARFRTAFEQDLTAIESLHSRHFDQVQADVMEVLLPPALLETPDEALDFFDTLDRTLATTGVAKLDLFLEVPVADVSADALKRVLAAMAEHNSRQPVPPRMELGLKVRCGGLSPEDVPDPQSLAKALTLCRDTSVRMKATAGLHHPMRHYDGTLETEAHGFINVFSAAVFATECELGVDRVQAILEDETAEHFRFEKDHLAWGDLNASLDGVGYVRDNLALSFGSCSFEEPVDHLKDLEIL